LIRQARESAGLHIGALAVSLKVPVKKIEALESDRLDLLPDAVFARALASSICRTLKIDAAPVLAGLPEGQRTTLKTDESSLNAAFHASGVAAPSAFAQQLSKPFVLIGLALVAGAAILLVAPDSLTRSSTAEVVGVRTGAAPIVKDAVEPMSQVISQNLALPAQTQTQVATDAKPADAPGAISPNASQNAPTAPGLAAAMAQSDVAPAALPAGAALSDNLIVFTAMGISWVEVTDASGVVQLRRTFAVGETAGVSGKSPLKVIVGRKDSVQVKVRGSDFDLGPVSRDNVARFEVR
jgi:cytoskeleton protein RodZ